MTGAKKEEDDSQGHHHQREKKQSHQQERQQQQNYVATLKILCLHEARWNAQKTHRILQELDERLYEKHRMEIVYIDSPLLVMGSTMDGDTNNNNNQRVWWENNGDDCPYLGLDASLLHIRQIWNSQSFCGIVAFGQGASVASLLPMMLPQLEFAIFVHGTALLEEEEPMIVDWPCLHIIRGKAYRLFRFCWVVCSFGCC